MSRSGEKGTKVSTNIFDSTEIIGMVAFVVVVGVVIAGVVVVAFVV